MSIIKCEICDYECNVNYFGTHTTQNHQISAKKYYELFLKKQDESLCLICRQQTRYISITQGYKKTCGYKCASLYRQKQLQEKHGVTNQFQLEEVKEKSKKTLLEKYGADNISKTEYAKNKIKNTKKTKHGDQHYNNRNKAQQTMKEKYGVENIMFIREFCDKAALNGGSLAVTKKYITCFGDEIYVQGTYEEKFVKYCEEKGYRIFNGPIISYFYENQYKNYKIDFEVLKEGQKILVEIKSSYWYDKQRDQVEAKAKYAAEYCSQNNMTYQLLIEKWDLE